MLWFIFIAHFCTASMCNENSQLGPDFRIRADCEHARTDLSKGRAEFYQSDEGGGAIPLSATECANKLPYRE